MFKAAARNLFAHKLRLALTALSIVLAVAFVAGTYIFTDSLRASLDNLIRQDQPDVIVQPLSSDFSADFRASGRIATVPTSLVERIEQVPDVAAVVPVIEIPNVVVLDADGKPLGQSEGFGGGGASFGQSWIPQDDLSSVDIVAGEAPSGKREVAMDTTTAEELAVAVGDQVTLLLPSGQRRTFTISALTELRNLAGFGVGFLYWDFATAQKLFLGSGEATGISVRTESPSQQAIVRSAIEPLLPNGVQAVTGEEQASAISEQLNSGLGFLNTFLLVFALVSLFVAAFLIYNTFSMLVAQRTRELALLRAIGASRNQILASILAEATLVALLASGVGIVVGAGIARGLQLLFSAAGAPFPATALVFQPRTIAVAMVIGLLITVLSALLPARRAATIAPVAAMREESGSPKPRSRRATIGGFLLGAGAGFAAMAPLMAANDAGRAAQMAAAAAAVLLIGVLMLSPELAKPVGAIIGAPFRGVNGRLARGNAERNPRRTAATAGALTIGVCLMSAISVLAASTEKSVSGLVDDVIGADFVATGYGFQPFPAEAVRAIESTPGVSATAVVRQAPLRAPGGDTFVTGVDPDAIQQALNLTIDEGSFDDLRADTVAIDSDTAAEVGAGVGTEVEVLSLFGPVTLKVVALYQPVGGFTGYVTDEPTAERLGASNAADVVYVLKSPDVDASQLQQGLEKSLADYPNVQLLDQSGFKDSINDQIGQLLTFLFALLLLAVLIALLGIVNTLALSVFERTREIGLLRAVGMSRSGVRRTIVIEAFIIAVFGATLGMVLGIGLGALLQRVLKDQGISEFAVNAGQLVGFLFLAALGGVLAALWPAWRASRLRILDAIATD